MNGLVAPHLVAFDGGVPHLVGSRCRACGEPSFPAANGCTRCSSTDVEAADLGREGRLWSWTVQTFLPKPPYDSGETAADFEPYGVGYVELACGLKVEARLTEARASQLAIGMPMALVLLPYQKGEAALQTFAFAPAGEPLPAASDRSPR